MKPRPNWFEFRFWVVKLDRGRCHRVMRRSHEKESRTRDYSRHATGEADHATQGGRAAGPKACGRHPRWENVDRDDLLSRIAPALAHQAVAPLAAIGDRSVRSVYDGRGAAVLFWPWGGPGLVRAWLEHSLEGRWTPTVKHGYDAEICASAAPPQR